MKAENFYLSSTDQVQISGVSVIGFDPILRQPLLALNAGSEFTLEQAQRQAWDNGEERFTEDEIKKIWDAVKHLKDRK